MDGTHTATDVVVIGAGPAGCATAIGCLAHGLSVTLLEREHFPREKPGETLHPGVEIILRRLGVYEQVLKQSPVRHRGIKVNRDAKVSFHPYGNDSRGEWFGYQVRRSTLDTILLNQVRSMGGKVIQPVRADKPISVHGRLIGVQAKQDRYFGRFIVDATGPAQWIQRALHLSLQKYSRPLFARYGYSNVSIDLDLGDEPIFNIDRTGWLWKAKIAENTIQWTEICFDRQFSRQTGHGFGGKVKGADVTWRHVPQATGNGYMIVGDAATILDPAASRGVLRALYSGVMASDVIQQCLNKPDSEIALLLAYKNWLQHWFLSDCTELMESYLSTGVDVRL